MGAEIMQYCIKSQITPRLANRIQLVFEELSQQLVKALDRPRIQAVIEYSESDEKATVAFRYNGKPFDVMEEGDELSLEVVKGMATDIRYCKTDSGEYANRVEIEMSA